MASSPTRPTKRKRTSYLPKDTSKKRMSASIEACEPLENTAKCRKRVCSTDSGIDCSDITETQNHHIFPVTVDIDRFKESIRECEEHHKACRMHNDTRKSLKNLKVIDCSRRVVVAAPEDCRFVALSYVWGSVNTAVCSDMSSKLPQTIEDSIKVTLLLGYRYLWIDRFCIQHGAVDKDLQIQQMGDIYSSAQVTLIAAAGNDPTYGLPGVTRERDVSACARYMQGYSHRKAQCRIPIAFAILDSVWASRAWTFQEGYLPKRRLYFTDIGTAFMCNAGEHSDHGLSSSLYLRGSVSEPVAVSERSGAFNRATSILSTYVGRALSYESDALNAIAGVLNSLLKRVDPVGHIWSVPFSIPPQGESIKFALLWSHRRPSARRPGFPSWSPLGWVWEQSRETNLEFDHYHCSKACSIDIWKDDKYQSLYSAVSNEPSTITSTPASSYLRMTLYTAHLEVVHAVGAGPRNLDSKYQVVLPITAAYDLHIRPAWDATHIPSNQQSLLCAFFTVDRNLLGLLLVNHGGHYERVGSFRVRDTIADADYDPLSRFKDLSHFFSYTFEGWDNAAWDVGDIVGLRGARKRTFLLR